MEDMEYFYCFIAIALAFWAGCVTVYFGGVRYTLEFHPTGDPQIQLKFYVADLQKRNITVIEQTLGTDNFTAIPSFDEFLSYLAAGNMTSCYADHGQKVFNLMSTEPKLWFVFDGQYYEFRIAGGS